MRRLGCVGVAAVLMLVALWTGSVAQATEVVSCADGGVCVVGDTGPGGGPVFYVASEPFASPGSACNTSGVGGVSTCIYLEAAPAGWIVSSTPASQTNCYTPGTSTVDPACQWSGNLNTLIGTTGTAIGAGHANTTAIIAQSDGGNTAGFAATVARAYQGGSNTDWFLPSKLELNQLCRYAWNLTIDNTATTCSGMSGDIRTGFRSDYYWSSSEYVLDGYAQYQWFDRDHQYHNSKANAFQVRPVRAFSTTPLLAPAFTLSSSSETKAQNVAITGYTISSTGGAIASYSIDPSAPAGTTFSSVTGLLSGTPTTVQSATIYTITATNATSTASQTFTLTVTVPMAAPAFTLSSSSETKAQNVAITGYTISSTGGAIASYSISPSAPAGTSFNTSTGLLSGTPTTAQSATIYTITATNATSTASRTFTLTVTGVTCANGGSCAVGDTGPGGGKVFYVSASPFASPGSACNTSGVGGISTCIYLEAAPSDQASGIVWATNAAVCYNNGSTSSTNDCQFNSIYSGNSAAQLTSFSVSLDIGMGMSNTNQIYARLTTAGSVATSSYAAGVAWAYTNNGKSDWFLPSYYELNELCKYARNQTPGIETTCDNSGSLRSGFSEDVYWSSSEYVDVNAEFIAQNAILIAFYGVAIPVPKELAGDGGVTINVRAVRAFSTTPLLAPGAPLRPTVLAGDARAMVTVAAGTGGTPTSFRVSASPQVGGVTRTCRVTGSSGSCIVGGLTNGQVYTFTATASNASGTSAASVASVSVTPLGVPAFTLSSTSETKAQNVAITGYTITSTGGAIASYSITPPAPAGTVFSTVTGLLSGTPTTARPPTRYTITATNASGFARSFFTLAVTLAAPGAPLQPTVVARDAGANVFVVAGVGGTPTSFLVSASPQVGGVTKGCKQFADQSFCHVKGLTNGVAYTFTATANNALGRSVASSASLSATPTARSCASGGPCAVGDTGRGGGIVFYVSASPFASPGSDCNTAGVGGISTCKYLEAAPSDQSSGIIWATSTLICYNSGSSSSTSNCNANSIYSGDSTSQSTSRASSTAIGMGMANTNQIYARLTTAGSVATTDYAAGVAWAYTNNSKTDWFVPSKDELNELCKYAKNTGQDAGGGTACTGGSAATARGFSAGAYWSSSEFGGSAARNQDFSTGTQSLNGKVVTSYLRAVRAFYLAQRL